jgi:hypothetical protein
MVTRRSGYLTRAFDCTLVQVLHYSLIGWERHTTASLDHLALMGELAWRRTVDHDYTAGSPIGAQWDTGYRGDYSGYHEGGSYYPSQGYLEPSLRAETSASARYPN